MVLVAAVNVSYALLYAALAYLAPGYLTAKALHSGNPSALSYWCSYWVVLSLFYCVQWVADFLLCWLPLYYVAKLGFIAALWAPHTQPAQPLYRGCQALLATYEADIDRVLHEVQTHIVDLASQQANALSVRARALGASAANTVNTVVNKAADRARTTKARSAAQSVLQGQQGQQPGTYAGQAGHGLHTE